MSMVQCQQLYELWKKVGLIKSKKTTKSSRALRARVAMLEAKTDNNSDRCLLADEKPKLMTEIIKPLTEREVVLVKAAQILDHQGHQKGTGSPVC